MNRLYNTNLCQEIYLPCENDIQEIGLYSSDSIGFGSFFQQHKFPES